eukprot:Hpha_TRINITY_DN14778_c0_g2::TRINITY_DN14778_c0_g2_i1::g.102469::m.102469
MVTEALCLPPRLLYSAPSRAFTTSEPPGLGLAELRSLHGRVVPTKVAVQYTVWVSHVVPPEEHALWHRFCLRRVCGAPPGCTVDARGSVVGALLSVLAVDQWLGGGGHDPVYAMEQWLNQALHQWNPQRELYIERQGTGKRDWDDETFGSSDRMAFARLPSSAPKPPKVSQLTQEPPSPGQTGKQAEISALEKEKREAFERNDFEACKELQARIEALRREETAPPPGLQKSASSDVVREGEGDAFDEE